MAVRVIGGARLRKKLRGIPKDARKEIRGAVSRGAIALDKRMKEKMSGPKSGRIYLVGKTKRQHQASAPGEPPAVLTGNLRRNLRPKVAADGLSASAGVHDVTKVRYARRLELGFVGTDSKGRSYNQAARPFIRPSFDELRAEIEKDIEQALRSATEKATRGRSGAAGRG